MKKRFYMYGIIILTVVSVYLVFTRPQYFVNNTDKFFGFDKDYHFDAEKTPAKELFTVKFLSLQAYMNTSDMVRLANDSAAYSLTTNNSVQNPFDMPENREKTEKALNFISDSDLNESLLTDRVSVIVEKYNFNSIRKLSYLFTSYAVYCAQKGDLETSAAALKKTAFFALCAERGYGKKPVLIDAMIARAVYGKLYDSINTILSTTSAAQNPKFSDSLKNTLQLCKIHGLTMKEIIEGEKSFGNKALTKIYLNRSLVMSMFDICNHPFTNTQQIYNDTMSYYSDAFSGDCADFQKIHSIDEQVSNHNYLMDLIVPHMKQIAEKTYEKQIQNQILFAYLNHTDAIDPLHKNTLLKNIADGKTLIYSTGVNGIDEKGAGDDIGYTLPIL